MEDICLSPWKCQVDTLIVIKLHLKARKQQCRVKKCLQILTDSKLCQFRLVFSFVVAGMRLRRISCWVAREVHLEKFLGWRLFTMICIYQLSENILFYSTTFKLSFFLIWFCLCYLLSCLKSCVVVLLKKGCRNPSPCLAQPQCQIAYNCQWGGCYACIFV